MHGPINLSSILSWGAHQIWIKHPSNQLLVYGPDNTQVLNIPCNKCIEMFQTERRPKHKCTDRACTAGWRRLCMPQQYRNVFLVTAVTSCILADRYQTFWGNVLPSPSIPVKMHDTFPSEILYMFTASNTKHCNLTVPPACHHAVGCKRRNAG